jgi:hypothetical protein
MHEAQFLNRPITIQSDLAAMFAGRALGFRVLLQINRHTPPQIDVCVCRDIGADLIVRTPIDRANRASNPCVPCSLLVHPSNTDIPSYARPIDMQSRSADQEGVIFGGDQKKDGEKQKSDKSKSGKSKSGKGGGREPQEPQEPKTRKVGY